MKAAGAAQATRSHHWNNAAASITIRWSASSGALTYNVKRLTASSGSYDTIASGVSGTSYVNTGLSRLTTYYYVVSAVNGCGESANSTPVSATTR